MGSTPMAYYYVLEHGVRSGDITAEQAIEALRSADVDPAPWAERLRQAEEGARRRALQ